MVTNITFNPILTTTGYGSFGVTWEGLIQGEALDAPNIRNQLAGGTLATTETLPMWGGVAITELVPGVSTGPVVSLGSVIGRATTVTTTATGGLNGFSVFDQNYASMSSPQSQVPLIPSGVQVNYYRLGSNARIAVACSPSLVSLEGALITQQVSWDFNNQVLQPYEGTVTYSITSITSSYSSATGLYTFAVVVGTASPVGAVGDYINISGVTGTGASLVNGDQVVTAYTSNTVFSFQVAAASGAIATGVLTGSSQLNYGTGPLNVRVLQVQPSNCMTVSYNAVTGFANWNRTGACAVILI